MYRKGKLFHETGTMFVLFHFIIYVVTTTLLSNVEGAGTSPSQREIDEAQKTVGRFLRDEAGTVWLSGIAKTTSAPLTTLELMNAITKSTTKGDRVWQAATILVEALKSQNLDSPRPDFATGQSENWKDLIANIELEDDIICLYRKNNNETTKKSDDWKTFLRSVSPGYTVHLAIDTGKKYVICLKKIDVPETTDDESLTTGGIITTVVTSVIPKEIVTETTSQLPMRDEISPTASGSRQMTNLPKVQTVSGHSDDDDARCNNKKIVSTKENRGDYDDNHINGENIDVNDDQDRDDNIFDDYDYMENKRRLKKYRRLMKNVYPGSYASGRITDKLDSRYERDNECKRPIIFVVPSGNGISAYQPMSPTGFPIQQYVGSNFPGISSNPRPSNKMPETFYNSLSFLPSNSPRLMEAENLRKPTVSWNIPHHNVARQAFIPQNTHFRQKLSDEKMQNKQFLRPTMLPIRASPRLQLTNSKFGGIDSVQGRPNFIDNPNRANINYARRLPIYTENPRYSSINSSPRRMQTSSGAKIQNNPLNVRGSTGFDQWRVPERYIAIPRMKNLDRSNQIAYDPFSRSTRPRNDYSNRQLFKNLEGSRFPSRAPIFTPQMKKSLQRPIVQPARPMFYDLPPPGQFPIGNQDFPARSSQSSMQNFNRMDPKLVEILRSAQRSPRFPCTNPLHPTTNYPTGNNLIRQPYVMMPTTSSTLIAYCKNPLNRFHPSCAVDSLGNSLVRGNDPMIGVGCPKPCDRPIKLQIVINGEIREPSRVSVLSVSGENLEIVGSVNPTMPHGSRALMDGPPVRNELYDIEENIQSKLDTPMNQRGEESSVKSDDSEGEGRSTMGNKMETTTIGSNIASNEGPGIEERFLPYTTIETNTGVETNETMSTTTNSTIIV